MQRPIRPAWLLRIARELAGEGAGPGQPRNTNLRRSTSSAYYALFHAIALAAASEAIPNGTLLEQHGYVRYVSHGAIKDACDWIGGNTPPQHIRLVVERLRRNAALSAVATAFRALQEAREAADYDHRADFTRFATWTEIDRATAAVALVEAEAESDDFRAFFGLISLYTRAR